MSVHVQYRGGKGSAKERMRRREEMSEVAECARRTSAAYEGTSGRTWVDHQAPYKYKESKAKLRGSAARRDDFAMREHNRRLGHMLSRIDRQSAVVERKKNAYDVNLYPATMRRRDAEDARDLPVRPVKKPPKLKKSRESLAKARPYLEFKQGLIDVIVERRMYRNDELLELFNRSLEVNNALPSEYRLDMERVARIVGDLREELDVVDENDGAASDASSPRNANSDDRSSAGESAASIENRRRRINKLTSPYEDFFAFEGY